MSSKKKAAETETEDQKAQAEGQTAEQTREVGEAQADQSSQKTQEAQEPNPFEGKTKLQLVGELDELDEEIGAKRAYREKLYNAIQKLMKKRP